MSQRHKSNPPSALKAHVPCGKSCNKQRSGQVHFGSFETYKSGNDLTDDEINMREESRSVSKRTASGESWHLVDKKLFVSGSEVDLKSCYSSVLHSDDVSKIKSMLVDVIRENCELKQEILKKDSKFLQLQLDHMNSLLSKKSQTKMSAINIPACLQEAASAEKDLKIRLAKTEIDLIEKSTALRDMEGRNGMLEEKLERLEEEHEILQKTHTKLVKSTREKNERLEERCKRTESRRRLEQTGLLEEIRECRNLLRILSKNSTKVSKMISLKTLDCKLKSCAAECVNEDEELKWMHNSKPAVSHKAMQVWKDYINRKLEQLENKVLKNRNNSGSGGVNDSLENRYQNNNSNTQLKQLDVEEDKFNYDLVELRPNIPLIRDSLSREDIDCCLHKRHSFTRM